MNGNMNKGTELARRVAKRWVDEAELVPLSVLALDHPEPVDDWETTLAARGIEVVEDDLFRSAIRREDARRLVQERREWERESIEKARRREESLEGPPVPAGVPSHEGMSGLEAMMAAPGYTTLHDELGRPRPSFLDDALSEGARRQVAEREAVRHRKEGRS